MLTSLGSCPASPNPERLMLARARIKTLGARDTVTRGSESSGHYLASADNARTRVSHGGLADTAISER